MVSSSCCTNGTHRITLRRQENDLLLKSCKLIQMKLLTKNESKDEHRYYVEITSNISFGVVVELLIDIFVHVIIFPKEVCLYCWPSRLLSQNPIGNNHISNLMNTEMNAV